MVRSSFNRIFNYYVIKNKIRSVACEMSFEIKSKVKVFSGELVRFSHASSETKTIMTCAVYVPNSTEKSINQSFPVLLYLSGLTCTDENVCQKSGVFKTLSDMQVRKINSNVFFYSNCNGYYNAVEYLDCIRST